MPKVSILCAVYNHEKYVADAIESVLAQTYGDWELLLWDDGSSDGSLNIIRRYAETYPEKIRVFRHFGGVNKGQEYTRNEAAKKAEGEFLALLDSDDLYKPNKLEVLIPLLGDDKVAMVYGNAAILIDGFEKQDGSIKPSGKIYSNLLKNNFIFAGSTLFRKSVFQAENLSFETKYKTIGEYPLWLAIAKKHEVVHVPQTVCVWRKHGGNLGAKLQLQGKQELVDLFKTFKSDAKSTPEKLEVEEALAQRHFDYANELYRFKKFDEAKTLFKKLLADQKLKPKLKWKTTLMIAALLLGPSINGKLSSVKSKLWRFRSFE